MLEKPFALLKRLFTLNDRPHDIALGLGLGVFLGVLPGTGPLAALICAQFLKINRAAAFLGALLTNTWFSLVILGVCAQVGAMLMSVDLVELNQQIQAVFRPFHLAKIFKLSFSRVFFPVLLGYLLISAAVAVLTYIAAFWALQASRSRKNRLA